MCRQNCLGIQKSEPTVVFFLNCFPSHIKICQWIPHFFSETDCKVAKSAKKLQFSWFCCIYLTLAPWVYQWRPWNLECMFTKDGTYKCTYNESSFQLYLSGCWRALYFSQQLCLKKGSNLITENLKFKLAILLHCNYSYFLCEGGGLVFNHCFNGLLQSYELWNRALSDSEVTSLACGDKGNLLSLEDFEIVGDQEKEEGDDFDCIAVPNGKTHWPFQYTQINCSSG